MSHSIGQAVPFGCSIQAPLQSQKFKNTCLSPWSHLVWLGVPIYGLDPGNNLTHLCLHWVFNKTFMNVNFFQIDVHVLFPKGKWEMSRTGHH